MSHFLARRTYVISIDEKTGDNLAYTWCESKGFGLAMWNSAESYEDVSYITDSEDEDFYTALNNENGESCDTKHNPSDCDDKLVWKQTKNGHSCSFRADRGFTEYDSDEEYRTIKYLTPLCNFPEKLRGRAAIRSA